MLPAFPPPSSFGAFGSGPRPDSRMWTATNHDKANFIDLNFRAGEEKNHDWWFGTCYGMSSFPLTNSIIFQRGRAQPPTR